MRKWIDLWSLIMLFVVIVGFAMLAIVMYWLGLIDILFLDAE